ncbi:Tetratricopeptide repeat-containing protein [Neorhodopirellula lusitana]|uniref:Tetratricopeptide repeat-containing protein n=1 Tax=Neorhodopirellula lusitana TaxID=445327 RepID=A0ABY1PZF6_9BACT|nr:tetratricopeptide repeat protein [Neorhodopirellula lusitana]SMP53961.1 Tetratricopeptide repeat-containing protein [Neorhodopirellula lusitana]
MSVDPQEMLLRRAAMLMEQRRFEAAQSELRRVLAENPEHTYAHALLSLALAQDDRIGDDARTEEHRDMLRDSTHHAQQAIASDPNDAIGYYALAVSWHKRDDFDAAIEAGNTAIGLDPYDADAYAIVAASLSRLRRYDETLETVERGLAVDPEHGGCSNLRSLALERLGRGEDAIASAEAQLKRNPDDSTAHAAVGFAHLNRGEHKQAQLAFREALRLDPTDEFARSGMIEAINTGNIFYRTLHRYFVWIGRLNPQTALMIMVGLWLLVNNMDSIAERVPFIAPYTTAITMTYILFALTTWIAKPLMDMLLRLHPFGRHLLNGPERLTSNLIGVLMAFAALSFVAGIALSSINVGMAGVVYCFLLAVFVVATMRMPTKKLKIGVGIASGIVAMMPWIGAIPLFIYGSLGIQFGSQMLASRTQRPF